MFSTVSRRLRPDVGNHPLVLGKSIGSWKVGVAHIVSMLSLKVGSPQNKSLKLTGPP